MTITLSKMDQGKRQQILSKISDIYNELIPELIKTVTDEKNNINGELKEKYSNYDTLLQKTTSRSGCDILKLPSNENSVPSVDIQKELRDKSALVMYGEDFYFANKGKNPIEITKIDFKSKDDASVKAIKDIFNSLESNYKNATDDELKKIRDILGFTPRTIMPLYKDKNAIDNQFNHDLEQSKVSLRINSERLTNTQYFNARIQRLKDNESSSDAIKIPNAKDITYDDMKSFSGLLAIKSMSPSSKNEGLFIKALKEQFDPLLNQKKDGMNFVAKEISILPEEKQYATNFINKITPESKNFYAYAHKVINVMEKPKDVNFSPLEQKINYNLINKIKSELVAFEKNNTPNEKNLDQLKGKINNIVEDKMHEIELNKIPVSEGWKGFINTIRSAIGFSKKYYEAPVNKEVVAELKKSFTFEKQKHESKEIQAQTSEEKADDKNSLRMSH